MDTMSAVLRHCILATSSLAIIFGTACESSTSLRASATSIIVVRGLSASTYAKHARHSHRMYGDKLANEVLRREKVAPDAEDELSIFEMEKA